MKFEQNALAQYLVNNLKSLTAADPNILADYVVALLKNDVPAGELQKLCADRLEAFLGHTSMSFTEKLFETLQEGSLQSINSNLDVMKSPEPSIANTAVETLDLKSLPPNEDSHSTSSEQLNDQVDKEISDDDDDRNHKHRRRDAPENSFDNDVQEQPLRRYIRKRSKDCDNGQLYMERKFQSHEMQREYNSTIDREVPCRLEKRHLGVPTQSLCSSGRASLGRGRGRNLATWSQYDSRFNSLDALDFTSQMASQRPIHPNLFVGAGLQGAGSSQNAPWGSYGFIHGMPNGIMDPLHPLGLQTSLRPTLSSMNLGMPRQRCRDFEERGFCLRGDMCPMEHGINRIVVEDVQSLSQFNLPVSIPNTHTFGVQAGSGSLHRGLTFSAPMTNKTMLSKNTKPAANDDGPRLSSISTVGGEADVYDPDQPLWNNSTNTSAALLKLPSPNTEDESLWDGKISCKSSRLSEENEGDLASRTLNAEPQGAGSSVWGRIRSGSKSDVEVKFENNNSATRHLANGMGDIKGATVSSSFPSNHGGLVISEEFGSKLTTSQPLSMLRTDFKQNSGGMQPKALRTLYVSGIPMKNNRKETLLPHFQKFGDVIDIYIPLESEKAFVQFSKREEAEAALKSPDAVMGNRFIRLFWANRDNRISDDEQNTGGPKPLRYPRVVPSSVQLRPPIEIDKHNLLVAVQRKTSTNSVELSLPSVGTQKNVVMNGSKAATSPTKKSENLELLEEIRRKQELLAQKRDEFRRQLVKFEKQASIKKTGALEQAAKRQKIEIGSSSSKAADSGSVTTSTLRECIDARKSTERSNIAETLVSPSSKSYPGTTTQSAQIVKQATQMLTPYTNRFKLDNRPTSFRVLPPLPAKLINVALLKDHFSKFGDLASVSLEDKDETGKQVVKEPEKSAVTVTFLTRHSAERAYQAGKSCDGCCLKFEWASTPVALKDRRGLDLSLNPVAPTQGNDKAGSARPSGPTAEPFSRRLFDADATKPDNHRVVEDANCSSIAPAASVVAVKSSPASPNHRNRDDVSSGPMNDDIVEARNDR